MDEKTRKIVHSSKTDEWSTPNSFFDKLNKMFSFTLDPCATHNNHKCPKYYTIEEDGLEKDWVGETVFVNPPYSKNSSWLEKCFLEAKKPKTTIVVLMPSRTDTRYWHDYAMKATHIYFIKGRLKFGQQKNSAPFPSALLVFNSMSGDIPPSIATMERT